MNQISSGIYPRKLNIGCGWDKREGFLNVDMNDFHEPDMVVDACDLSTFPDGSFDFILAQDILEHMERSKTDIALGEWARVLSESGVISIRVPNLLGMFGLLYRPENQGWEGHEKIIHLMYGTQAYTGDYHLAGFTAEVLVEHLRRAGLKVRKASIVDEWLFDIEAVKFLRTPEEAVQNLYFEVLGRPADAMGAELYTEELRTSRMSIEMIKQSMQSSDEYRSKHTLPIPIHG